MAHQNAIPSAFPDRFDEDLDRSLGFLLNDVSRLMRSHFDKRAHSLGLTRAQWRVMVFLRRQEGLRQNELAALLEIETVTLGRHIDRLEENGWVMRRQDPADRRARQLFLATKSRAILDQLAQVFVETRETALAGFADGKRQQMVTDLLAMKANLTAAGEVDKPGSAPVSREPGPQATTLHKTTPQATMPEENC